VTDHVPIPYDEEAEKNVAACCAMTPAGRALAGQRLSTVSFYLPAAARVFAVSSPSGWMVPSGADRIDRRVASVAAAAAIDVRDLRQWVADCPVAVDTAGAYAVRVADAARRRQLMTLASDLHVAAAEGQHENFRALLDRLQDA
jgi:replicative DNA helicase